MLVDREAVERDNAALAQRLRLAKLRRLVFWTNQRRRSMVAIRNLLF